MNENPDNLNKEKERESQPRLETGGVKWVPAVEIMSQVSAWIAGPIILALIAGKYLDTRFGTKPWMFLIFAGLGFLITIFGITQAVRKFISRRPPESGPRPESVGEK